MRQVYSLPVRMGGLGFEIPQVECDLNYENSKIMTAQLANAIFNQDSRLEIDDEEQVTASKLVSKRRREHSTVLMDQIREEISDSLFKLLLLSSEKGASIWLTSLPLREFGFRLNKQQFEDALCLRYNLPLKDVPRRCACGADYSIDHCLSCKNGGYVSIRHNAVRDTTSEILKEVCKDVRVEPALLPVTGEDLPAGSNVSDGARADVSALGFWMPLSRAFFDVRVINPMARYNWSKEVDKMYKHHEDLKKREYAARILQIEKGSFTPIVFSCTGGAASEANIFIKRLALKLSEKKQERYSSVVSFLRRRLRFDLLKSCLISFRGERKSRLADDSAPVAVADLHIELTRL